MRYTHAHVAVLALLAQLHDLRNLAQHVVADELRLFLGRVLPCLDSHEMRGVAHADHVILERLLPPHENLPGRDARVQKRIPLRVALPAVERQVVYQIRVLDAHRPPRILAVRSQHQPARFLVRDETQIRGPRDLQAPHVRFGCRGDQLAPAHAELERGVLQLVQERAQTLAERVDPHAVAESVDGLLHAFGVRPDDRIADEHHQLAYGHVEKRNLRPEQGEKPQVMLQGLVRVEEPGKRVVRVKARLRRSRTRRPTPARTARPPPA